MPRRARHWLLSILLPAVLAGCADGSSPAPPLASDLVQPHLLFMVKNEVFGIRLDGTSRRSFGVAGDDRRRAGYPRLLPDGRLSVVADEVGRVFPFTSDGGRGFERVDSDAVWLGDGACGATVRDHASLIWFSTSIYLDGTLTATALRASTDGRSIEGWGFLEGAGLFGPSADGPDHLLAVHSPLVGDDEIWRIDASGDQESLDHPEVVARIPFPHVARSPGRLRDGRVVFVVFDMRDHNRYGELWVVETDGATHPTAILGVDDVTVVGDRVVYEAGGGTGVADLMVTDLASPPQNLTNTPFIAEHLGWGAPEMVDL
jgi:hypothetical protein